MGKIKQTKTTKTKYRKSKTKNNRCKGCGRFLKKKWWYVWFNKGRIWNFKRQVDVKRRTITNTWNED